MKAAMMSLAMLAFLVPQEVLAANVYIPVVCETVRPGLLDCNPNSVNATLNTSTNTWEITVAQGDTVYLQVSDFTEGSDNWSVTAETEYVTATVGWSKSGATATSPGDSPEITFEIEVEASTGTKIGHGRRRFKIRGTGA